MTDPWLHIVGIGEDGMDGLSLIARHVVENADIIVGGDRHHSLSAKVDAERIAWPSPFDAMIDKLHSLKGQRVVVLVTGDPLWYSVGARIAREINPAEIVFYPQLSAFQWSAARMGWSLADCATLTVHGRANSQLIPHIAPRARLLVLTKDSTTPAALASILTERGFGESRIVALCALGGEKESRVEGVAQFWDAEVPDFHTLAIECIASHGAVWNPCIGGLPDNAFVHDGQLTKRDIRAATLAKLAPFPDAILWDIGAGCGSVGIEWMRSARSAQAVAIEPNETRRTMIVRNCVQLGTEKLKLIAGRAPDALNGLPQPDAVFIGGGLTGDGVFEAAWDALRPGGRLVANAVTLESESRLAHLHKTYGGDLVRICVQHAEPVGPYRGWRASMPVTQWCVVKGAS